MGYSFRCLTHGPSPVVEVEGKRQCGRCAKRQSKNIEKVEEDANSKKEKGKAQEYGLSGLARPLKLPGTASLKGIRSAYLQVVVVPPEAQKTEEEAEKSRQKKLKRKEEIEKNKSTRESRLQEACKSYGLSLPYYYSPFVCHPQWQSERKVQMGEYLHNVQAVLQSYERHNKHENFDQMKGSENKLYRTTKKAAFRVLYMNVATPIMLEFLPDQHASAAYRDFLRNVKALPGPRPQISSPDDCSPEYTSLERSKGPERRFSTNTYRAQKYELKSYRHQRNHKYSVPYMVKGTVGMNQIVYPKWSGRRNLTIMKHLRTVMILRKLFYHHNEEFRKFFQKQVTEHAIDLKDAKVSAKWKNFLESGDPPEKLKDLLQMASLAGSSQEDKLSDYCVWDDTTKGPDCLYLSKPKPTNENGTKKDKTGSKS